MALSFNSFIPHCRARNVEIMLGNFSDLQSFVLVQDRYNYHNTHESNRNVNLDDAYKVSESIVRSIMAESKFNQIKTGILFCFGSLSFVDV